MECPRCHEPAPLAALACGVCSAPLRLREEPPPVVLDRPLDLDRRRRDRPAATPAPLAAPITLLIHEAPLPDPLPAARGEGAGTLGAPRSISPLPDPLPAARGEGAGTRGASGEEDERRGDRPPAPLGARALAALVDVLLVAIATAPPVLLAAWSLPGPVDVAALTPAALALAALVAVAYGALALGLAGATPGGRLVGLAVLDGDGQAPGMGRAAARAALAVLGTVALGAGLWPALFTESRQTLHDRVAGTFVVRMP